MNATENSSRYSFSDTMKSLSEIGRTVRHYPRAVGLMLRASPKETVVFSVFNLLSAAVTPLQIWLSKYIIDEVVAAVQATQGTAHLRQIAFLVGLQLLIWLASNAITSIINMLRYPMGLRVSHYTEELIFQKLARLDLAFFESPTFFDQMAHAREQSIQRIP
ncbi:MAG: hypothetical protein OXU27_12245, partial [Candidatus Poribacteria bacterium]|nr:hypothetical protein [Candidatus Poribacteria bacterium]